MKDYLLKNSDGWAVAVAFDLRKWFIGVGFHSEVGLRTAVIQIGPASLHFMHLVDF